MVILKRKRAIADFEELWPSAGVRYATVASAWGDTFLACGFVQELLRRLNRRTIGVVCYTSHRQIVDFVGYQPWCSEVIHVEPSSVEQLFQVARYPDGPDRWAAMADLLRVGLDPGEVWPTHIRLDGDRVPKIYPYRDAYLPLSAWTAAAAIRDALPRDTYFLHPWSFQSCALRHHWPHWQAFVARLLERTAATYVLTGTGYDGAEFGEHPRLVNLVGKQAHMSECLALACLCRGVITTCNSPALWSAVRRLRAFVIGNRAIPQERPRNQFYRFITDGSAVTWNWDVEPLESVWAAFEGWAR